MARRSEKDASAVAAHVHFARRFWKENRELFREWWTMLLGASWSLLAVRRPVLLLQALMAPEDRAIRSLVCVRLGIIKM